MALGFLGRAENFFSISCNFLYNKKENICIIHEMAMYINNFYFMLYWRLVWFNGISTHYVLFNAKTWFLWFDYNYKYILNIPLDFFFFLNFTFLYIIIYWQRVIWLQVFLSHTNNSYIIWFQVFLSHTNNSYIIWFQVTLPIW